MAGLFDSLFTNVNAENAAGAQKAGLAKGLDQFREYAGEGRDALTTNYAAGLAPYQQNYAQAGAGQTAYGNATGVNGEAGYADALKSFHTGPGYEFALQQGSDNVMRNKAATGQLASGGTNIDLQKLGIGMADQQWNQYVQNLLPFLGASNQAAGGIGTLNAGLGNQLNANLMGVADKSFQTQAGIGNADANAELANNNAANNSMAAIQQGVKLATQLAGFLG